MPRGEQEYDGSSPPRGDSLTQVDIYNDRQIRKGNFETNFPQPVDIKHYKKYLLGVAAPYLQAFNETQVNKIVEKVLEGLKSGKYKDQVGKYYNETFIKYLLETERGELSHSDTKDTVWS